MVNAVVVAVSVWLCRFTMFEALQWWTGVPPSDGLILGSLILSSGVLSAPIVTQHFSHIQVLYLCCTAYLLELLHVVVHYYASVMISISVHDCE